jgi:ABC-2 type transport system permease protein
MTTNSSAADTNSTHGTGGLWRIVAEREITTRVRDKTFVISTIVLLVSLVATIVITGWMSDRDHDRQVAVVDPAGRAIVEKATDVAGSIDEGTSLTPRTVENVKAAERLVSSGKADAALVPSDGGYQVVGDDEIDEVTSQALSATVASAVLDQNARAMDVDLERLQAGTAVDERLLDPAAKDAGLRKLAAFLFVLVFYVTALGFGMTIAQSVTQEKESRVVEILAAAVPLRALLWGKIAGNTVLAVAQVLLTVAAGAIAMVATGRGDDLRIVGPAMGWYVIFFVLGFVALASLWSVAGSLASRQQDLQATTMPGQILLFAPYILAVTAGEGVKTVVSMLPVVSTMMMPVRMAEGAVPAWQVAVAILTTVVAAVLMVRVGAAAYERTLLRTGDRIGYREALAPSVGTS